MARKPRQWSPNTSYHITCRGNRKSNIFLEQEDFYVYLNLVTEALQEFQEESPYELLSYCLMNNHVHLLVHTSSKPLANFMKKINMNYAIYFNKKYDYTGHLFQGRFFSDPARTTSQLLAVSSYIHLNPVEANMVKNPEDYPFSSYRSLIGLKKCTLVSSDKILGPFESEHTYRLYQDYVESKLEGQSP